MLDRVYHVTAHGVLDLILVQVTLVLVQDGHALEVGSRERYIAPDPDEDSQRADLVAISAALSSLADELG